MLYTGVKLAKILLVLSLIVSVSFGSEKDKTDQDDEEATDYMTILNNEAETGDSAEPRTMTQEEADDSIDRMPHVKSSTIPPATYKQQGFDEYIPESTGVRDKITNSHLDVALDVLQNRRSAEYTYSDLRAAYLDLETAADNGNDEAKKLLGFTYLFGEYRWSVDEAKKLFVELSEKGSTDGHLGMAMLHFTGITMKQPDRGKGLLHLQFAANGGNSLAQMAMGYRFIMGIDVKKNCDKAMNWYRLVSKKVASKVTFLGGTSVQKIRIPDDVDGLTTTQMDINVFTYYKYLAENGDIPAIISLANFHLTGLKGVHIDHKAAARYFTTAADAGNAQAYAHLGKMYYDGTIATPRDDDVAFAYFKKAADKGNALGQAGLGLMYLDGRGVRADFAKAIKLFTLAAEQGSVDGQFYLGYMHYKGHGHARDYKIAAKYFQLASQSGHLLAIYNLAQMHANGIGVTKNCPIAVELFKSVAERGRWSERFMETYSKYQAGALDEAAFDYMVLGELGYEIAQTNFAYLIEENIDSQQLFHTKLEGYKWALTAWQRSANQNSVYARVRLGDYNYYGLGTSVDYTAALEHYKIAADTHQSAQAMFNLGYMHEQGLGLGKDLHLAKRYYDQAAETSADAFAPVALAMLKLRIVFFMDYMKENLAWHSALIVFLDSQLGPHWDFFVMSVLLAIIPYLLFQHYQNRRLPNRPVPVVHVQAQPQEQAAHE